MTSAQVMQQLLIARNLLECARASVDLALSAYEPAPESAPDVPPEPGVSDTCTHPVDDRISAATMGHMARFVCRQCKQTVDP